MWYAWLIHLLASHITSLQVWSTPDVLREIVYSVLCGVSKFQTKSEYFNLRLVSTNYLPGAGFPEA